MSRYYLLFWLTISLSPAATAVNCDLIYDEFDSLMNKDFLVAPNKYVNVQKERLSLRDFRKQQKQFLLRPDRSNLGVAIVKTNKGDWGKLLLEWKRQRSGDKHPTLIVRQSVIYQGVKDGYRPAYRRDIRVASSYTLDLDTGQLGGGQADIWFNNIDGNEMYIQAVNGAQITFPMDSLCKAKPKVTKINQNAILNANQVFLAKEGLQLVYPDGSKKNFKPDGIDDFDGENMTPKIHVPENGPIEPPDNKEQEWLVSHKDKLKGIITQLANDPEGVNSILPGDDEFDSIYQNIDTYSLIIELLAQESP